MIDALPFRRPNQNYRILATQTGESSIYVHIIIPTLSLRTLRQYLLVTIESSLTDLLSFGLRFGSINAKALPTRRIHSAWRVSRLCLDLLPESIALSDAFGLTDWELDRYVYTNSCCHFLR